MHSSQDEASRLLQKWKTEGTLLHVIYAGNNMGVNSACVVRELSPSEMSLGWETGELILSLTGASFEYAEPREAPAAIKFRSEAKYVCCVTVSLSSGYKCGLYELRFE